MISRLSLITLLISGLGIAWFLIALPREKTPILRLGSTTSTKDSGLLDHLLPLYEAEAGIDVVVIAKGTGAAIRDGLAGQVDALLVHNKAREEELVAEGYALSHIPLMSNDFLIVGGQDQAIADDLATLLAEFASGDRGLFLSRGDQSGTHAAEQRLWATYGLDPNIFGDWYATTGTGMGQTLITANTNAAATLVDSATWARHGGKGQLKILFNGADTPTETGLENPYGYLSLNPERIPGVQADLAEDFGAWLAGPTGQAAIAAYHIDGMQAFRPESE